MDHICRIADVLKHLLDSLAESGVNVIWTDIKAKESINNNRANSLKASVESTNKHFAIISFDPRYNLEAVTAFRQDMCDPIYYAPLNADEVKPMLRWITKTAGGSDNIPYWVINAHLNLSMLLLMYSIVLLVLVFCLYNARQLFLLSQKLLLQLLWLTFVLYLLLLSYHMLSKKLLLPTG